LDFGADVAKTNFFFLDLALGAAKTKIEEADAGSKEFYCTCSGCIVQANKNNFIFTQSFT